MLLLDSSPFSFYFLGKWLPVVLQLQKKCRADDQLQIPKRKPNLALLTSIPKERKIYPCSSFFFLITKTKKKKGKDRVFLPNLALLTRTL